MEDLYACAMALPPLEDQKTIVAFLDSELAKFDTLTAEAQRAIDLLQERRTALISAAVTGKIDVRHWQPPAGSETGTPPDRGAFA
jgi:type I restriction enzyme S subunit